MQSDITATVVSRAPEQLLCELHLLFPTLSAAYLFGSAARDALTSDSDLDIAVDVGQPMTATKRWNAAQKLAARFSRDVDLIDFRVASAVLRHQILTTGQRLFARDPAAQASYEAAVLSEYLDFVAQRAPLMRDIAARGSVYVR